MMNDGRGGPPADPPPDPFAPVRVGTLTLKNRIVMAPMTRSRAGEGDAPTELTQTYYAQRASAGLLVSEATYISPQAKGYAFTPGIFTGRQVAAWAGVTEAVHSAGGLIFSQLWHVGRRSHPDLQPGGALPVSPSAVRPAGNAFTGVGRPPFVTPRALETEEIAGVVRQYRDAASCAKEAGFDGIELHGANGYLIDQFLRDRTNRRTDIYGGPPENRVRFLREVLEAVAKVWEPGRIGLRISPVSPVADMADSDPEPLFLRAVEEMNAIGIAYLHVIEGDSSGPREVPGAFDLQLLRQAFDGCYIANNGFDRALALATIESKRADLISFGRPFIANPDLVERLRRNAPLNEVDRAHVHAGGALGYTDYPTLEEADQKHRVPARD
jgi:N-ethylmaleimide reductase